MQIVTRKKNFHEIELSDFSLDEKEEQSEMRINGNLISTTGVEVFTTNISLRYEYIRNIAKLNKSRFMPAIGFSAQPYYLNFKTNPFTSITMPHSETKIGVRFAVIPRVTIFATKRLFFDVNLPINLLDMYVHNVKSRNPSIPVALQDYSVFNVDAGLPHFSMRIGAGFKL